MSPRLLTAFGALFALGCANPPAGDPATKPGVSAVATDAAPMARASSVASASSLDASSPDAKAAAAKTSRDVLLDALDAHPEVTTLDAFVPFVPRKMRESFVLKHGVARKGERGHLVETRISQSADPDAPRVVAWDDSGALAVSFNGGTPRQTNGHRFDMLWLDPSAKTFVLDAIDFENGKKPRRSAEGCAACHGPSSRPIFSMYPDWPGFYGSDNDELTSAKVAAQVAERADLAKLRARVATLPRYAPLFSEDIAKERFDRPMWETYPYRPDTATELRAVSRAFAYRPGLRLGIVLARLQSIALVAKVRKHAAFAEAAPVLRATLLGCPLYEKATARVRAVVDARLHEPAKLVGRVLHARQAWKLFDLEIGDVDIRYSYGHEGYASDDASKNPMAIGYIGNYWASYFDGSATLDELVAWQLVKDDAALAAVAKPHGLASKYRHLEERYRLDAAFFDAMDGMSMWLSVPYPKILDSVQHREGFGAEHQKDHAALCAEVVRGLE